MSIKATELCKNYMVGGQRVAALDGVSLEVGDGEYVTVVGASGSGKTTLMNILGCLDLPTSGSYFLDGDDVSTLTDEELSEIRSVKIGFIFQSFNLIEGLTALENVELPLLYRNRKRSGAKNSNLNNSAQINTLSLFSAAYFPV